MNDSIETSKTRKTPNGTCRLACDGVGVGVGVGVLCGFFSFISNLPPRRPEIAFRRPSGGRRAIANSITSTSRCATQHRPANSTPLQVHQKATTENLTKINKKTSPRSNRKDGPKPSAIDLIHSLVIISSRLWFFIRHTFKFIY